MYLKKCMAVLLSVALALCLVLTGCGGSGPLTEVILDLLDGYYKNIAVDSDPDLEKALREAVDQGGTEEEILARIINSMNLTGSSIQFTRLGDGQQGDHALDVVFQLGTDPDAAARQAMAEWSRIFGSLPSDGQYEAHVSMVEENGGYYVAVDVTVVKAGRSNQDDEEDGPVVLTEISVSGDFKKEYYVGQTFDKKGMIVTAYYSNSTSKQVTDYTVSPETFETEKIGATVTITYTEGDVIKTATVTVNVESDPGYTIEGGTYMVYNADGLMAWAAAAKEKPSISCTLTDDINLEGRTWTPVGTSASDGYTGIFDGGNYAITNLEIHTSESSNQGLFGYVGSGAVQNLKLENVSITAENSQYVGAVAGYSTGTIENCVVSGTVSGGAAESSQYVGAVAGYSCGRIENCEVSGSVSGGANVSGTNASSVGGVAGGNAGGEVVGCSSTASVTANGSNSRVGGVVGNNMMDATVVACYHTTGAITATIGDTNAGGVVGRNNGAQVVACYASCAVEVNNGGKAYAGGVVGNNTSGSSLEACYWAGSNKKNCGVGNNSAHTGATKVGDGVTWTDAVKGMNAKLSDSWKFAQNGDESSLPTLSK